MAFDLSKIKTEDDFWKYATELSADDIQQLLEAKIISSNPDIDVEDLHLTLDDLI